MFIYPYSIGVRFLYLVATVAWSGGVKYIITVKRCLVLLRCIGTIYADLCLTTIKVRIGTMHI